MTLWEQVSKLFGETRQHFVEHPFDPAATDVPGPSIPVEADRHYFRVTLAQMFLRQRSEFLTTYYPAAYSVVTALFDGKPVDVSNVADESRLTAKQDGRGDVVAKNFVLSPLMPFKGGVVNLALSLHAVEGQNQLRSFLKTMGEFAKLLVVPQLSAAIELAGPLSAGLQGLFGQTNGAAHLVYANTFVGKSSTSADAKNYLRSGYVAVLRAPEPGLDRGQLLVVNNELRVGASLGNNAAFDGCDYLLLRVEVREDRDDFNELPGIKSAMDRALEAIVAAEDAKADAFYRVAVTAALQAPELTRADRRRVIELLKRDFEEAKGGFRPTGLVGGHGMDLQARWAQQGMTVDEALARGEPTLEEALAP